MNYNKYLPVSPDFDDILESEIKKQNHLTVHYFKPDMTVEVCYGKYISLEKNKQGEFLKLSNNKETRIDRIITINGKIGPAFIEYENFANQCFSCLGNK